MNLLTRFRRRNFLLATLLLGLASPLAAQQKTVAIPLADGFDYPIGKPDGKGYYVARGLRLREPIHFGEDWNGNGGGDTDMGDPVYATANGVVMFSYDVQAGWGNIVILRHAYRDLQTGLVTMCTGGGMGTVGFELMVPDEKLHIPVTVAVYMEAGYEGVGDVKLGDLGSVNLSGAVVRGGLGLRW